VFQTARNPAPVRQNRQSKLRLEQFKIFVPDYSIHPWRDARAYAVDGKQYIAVGTGGNTNLPFKRGNDIIASRWIDRRGSMP